MKRTHKQDKQAAGRGKRALLGGERVKAFECSTRNCYGLKVQSLMCEFLLVACYYPHTLPRQHDNRKCTST